MQRSLTHRLERLEAQAEPRDMPCLWMLLSAPDELISEAHGCGRSISRAPNETWPEFKARAEAELHCQYLTGTSPMTTERWQEWANNNPGNTPPEAA